jgi:cell division transport system ATP-binding protein
VLELRNVGKVYPGDMVALFNVSLVLNPGELVTVYGPTGAGKTTLIKLISAEEIPTDGEILFDGLSSLKLRGIKLLRWRQRIGTLYQDLRLLKDKTVAANVAIPLRVLGKTGKEIENLTLEMLSFLRMEARQDSYPEELSAGEKQKVALARALVSQPLLILADEPTANLDTPTTQEVLNLIRGLNHLGNTILLTTNQKEVADFLTFGRVYQLNLGRLS